MTFAQKAIGWLGWKAVAQPAAPAVSQSEPEPMTRLANLLQIQVARAGDPKIFTQEMSTSSLLFHGASLFEAGETVTLRVMLQSSVHLTMQGVVAWVHEGNRGSSGQIDFQAAPEQKAPLAEFLRLRRVR
jgi:hypothetical protein